MSLCSECKSTLNNTFIKCDCGYAIDYDCLIIAGLLPNDYNNLTQSKYALHLYLLITPLIPQPQVYEKLIFTACENPTVTKHVLCTSGSAIYSYQRLLSTEPH